MIGIGWWQGLLDGLGAVLAFFYKYVPNYGVAIILLTLVIRILLLPLAFKQIRSMQAMQVIQPKVKELQRKYKGNREQLNQAMMALYKEHGVNPLSGCLPLLAQFPVLIALFAVLRFPQGLTHIPHNEANPDIGIEHGDSRLYVDLVNQKADFLGMNLLCSASQAGSTVKLDPKTRQEVPDFGGNTARLWARHPGEDPLLRVRPAHVGDDVRPATTDAAGISQRKPAAADDDQDHAVAVRRVGLHLPCGPGGLLDHDQLGSDRATAVHAGQAGDSRRGRWRGRPAPPAATKGL